MIGKWKSKKMYDSLMGINERNMDFVYALNPKKYFDLAEDKVKCKEMLHAHGIACAETYSVIRKVSEIAVKWEAIKHHQKLAIKPKVSVSDKTGK